MSLDGVLTAGVTAIVHDNLLGSTILFEVVKGTENAIFWGFHATISIAAMIALRKRGLDSKSSLFLFTVLGFILFLSTITVVSTAIVVMQMIQDGLIRHMDLSMEERMDLVNQRMNQGVIAVVHTYLATNGCLMYLIGEMVIVWRGWALWAGRRIFIGIPISLVTASTVLSVTSCTTFVVKHVMDLGADTIADHVYNITRVTAVACSLAANALVTSMIGVMAYQHRKLMKHATGIQKSSTITIIFYLIEAGLVYWIIQVVGMVLTALNHVPLSRVDYAAQTWQIFATNVSITYPAMIVLMVSYNRSLVNNSAISSSHSAVGTHISFTHSTSEEARMADVHSEEIPTRQMEKSRVEWEQRPV